MRKAKMTFQELADATRVSKHHPTLYVARQSCWATCACGWKSKLLLPEKGKSAAVAALVWAQHVEEAEKNEGFR